MGSVTPIDTYLASSDGMEVGKAFTMLGYGNYGPRGGPYTSTGGTLHFGHNIFDSIVGNQLMYTMTQNGLEYEAIAWSGDSGGPALIDVNGTMKLAGVNSG